MASHSPRAQFLIVIVRRIGNRNGANRGPNFDGGSSKSVQGSGEFRGYIFDSGGFGNPIWTVFLTERYDETPLLRNAFTH
jgi:hypothetical protein